MQTDYRGLANIMAEVIEPNKVKVGDQPTENEIITEDITEKELCNEECTGNNNISPETKNANKKNCCKNCIQNVYPTIEIILQHEQKIKISSTKKDNGNYKDESHINNDTKIEASNNRKPYKILENLQLKYDKEKLKSDKLSNDITCLKNDLDLSTKQFEEKVNHLREEISVKEYTISCLQNELYEYQQLRHDTTPVSCDKHTVNSMLQGTTYVEVNKHSTRTPQSEISESCDKEQLKDVSVLKADLPSEPIMNESLLLLQSDKRLKTAEFVNDTRANVDFQRTEEMLQTKLNEAYDLIKLLNTELQDLKIVTKSSLEKNEKLETELRDQQDMNKMLLQRKELLERQLTSVEHIETELRDQQDINNTLLQRKEQLERQLTSVEHNRSASVAQDSNTKEQLDKAYDAIKLLEADLSKQKLANESLMQQNDELVSRNNASTTTAVAAQVTEATQQANTRRIAQLETELQSEQLEKQTLSRQKEQLERELQSSEDNMAATVAQVSESKHHLDEAHSDMTLLETNLREQQLSNESLSQKNEQLNLKLDTTKEREQLNLSIITELKNKVKEREKSYQIEMTKLKDQCAEYKECLESTKHDYDKLNNEYEDYITKIRRDSEHQIISLKSNHKDKVIDLAKQLQHSEDERKQLEETLKSITEKCHLIEQNNMDKETQLRDLQMKAMECERTMTEELTDMKEKYGKYKHAVEKAQDETDRKMKDLQTQAAVEKRQSLEDQSRIESSSIDLRHKLQDSEIKRKELEQQLIQCEHQYEKLLLEVNNDKTQWATQFAQKEQEMSDLQQRCEHLKQKLDSQRRFSTKLENSYSEQLVTTRKESTEKMISLQSNTECLEGKLNQSESRITELMNEITELKNKLEQNSRKMENYRNRIKDNDKDLRMLMVENANLKIKIGCVRPRDSPDLALEHMMNEREMRLSPIEHYILPSDDSSVSHSSSVQCLSSTRNGAVKRLQRRRRQRPSTFREWDSFSSTDTVYEQTETITALCDSIRDIQPFTVHVDRQTRDVTKVTVTQDNKNNP